MGSSLCSELRHLLLKQLMFIHSFIHSSNFYSASSGALLLRSAPDTARTCMLCRSFKPERQRQLRGNALPKVPTWRLERDLTHDPMVERLRLYQCATTIVDVD